MTVLQARRPAIGPPVLSRGNAARSHPAMATIRMRRSHGETFLEILRRRIVPRGLYFLDEPETPLSPTRVLALLVLVHEAAAEGSQFVIATHSPILAALPEAQILADQRRRDGRNGLRGSRARARHARLSQRTRAISQASSTGDVAPDRSIGVCSVPFELCDLLGSISQAFARERLEHWVRRTRRVTRVVSPSENDTEREDDDAEREVR